MFFQRKKKKQPTVNQSEQLFYPTGSEVFEALEDIEISFMTHFMAPFTGGDNALLLKGERIVVNQPNRSKPTSYYCYPINDEQVENRIVSDSDRDDPRYNGYSLFISTKSLNTDFKQVELAPIQYVQGDATSPEGGQVRIIVHICNDVGGWGKGFVLAISKKWPQPEKAYRQWYKDKGFEPTDGVQFERISGLDRYTKETSFDLGHVQFVQVADNLWVANMLAQYGIKRSKDGIPPIRYSYAGKCLERVRQFAQKHNASVHMPRIGCGLAGGKWDEMEEIVKSRLIAHEVATTVYDLG